MGMVKGIIGKVKRAEPPSRGFGIEKRINGKEVPRAKKKGEKGGPYYGAFRTPNRLQSDC